MKRCFNLERKIIGMDIKNELKIFRERGKRVSKYGSFNLLIYRNASKVIIWYILSSPGFQLIFELLSFQEYSSKKLRVKKFWIS